MGLHRGSSIIIRTANKIEAEIPFNKIKGISLTLTNLLNKETYLLNAAWSC